MIRNRRSWRGAGLLVLVLLGVVLSAGGASSEEPARTFATPDEAAKAFVEAVGSGRPAVLALLGSGGEDLMPGDGTDPAAKEVREAFLAKAKEAVALETQEDGSVLVVVGSDRWPMPIPLVKAEGGWHFDAAAGREEILARVIGYNELGAVALLKDLAAAQEAYEAVDRDGDGLREYAQRFRSADGQKDGLWWEGGDSPLGLEVGDLLDDLAKNPNPDQTVYGYRWKMLKGQGEKAPGGAFSYLVRDNQVAGYAFVAVPAAYRKTAVMSFLVAKNGRILEKDLGEQGTDLAKAMETYDPDDTWVDYTPETAK